MMDTLCVEVNFISLKQNVILCVRPVKLKKIDVYLVKIIVYLKKIIVYVEIVIMKFNKNVNVIFKLNSSVSLFV